MNSKVKKEFMRTVKYFSLASSAGVIEMGAFTLLTQYTVLDYSVRYLIALVLSIVWNFTLNRRFTFKSNNNIPIAMTKVFLYYAVFTPVSTFGGNYLVNVMHWNDYLVTTMTLIINGVTEYLFQRFFVFGHSIDSKELSHQHVSTVNRPF
ncbi:GtrA family protein [Sporolactobacillus kofuensis]|uniref:GtrA family protein n=1 Tax=Sporolactobacillus kofuensis TaxID=269672 RepID=A0ABW1WFS9_9BACL|nr:GtrA family protein [Sporolactobacillus kofuensis]MCO7175762.1 GtrA family protein [Sporolactobacillus kofuensis]